MLSQSKTKSKTKSNKSHTGRQGTIHFSRLKQTQKGKNASGRMTGSMCWLNNCRQPSMWSWSLNKEMLHLVAQVRQAPGERGRVKCRDDQINLRKPKKESLEMIPPALQRSCSNWPMTSPLTLQQFSSVCIFSPCLTGFPLKLPRSDLKWSIKKHNDV